MARPISSCLDHEHYNKERSASLDLLLRFQRLLVSKLYPGDHFGHVSNTYSKYGKKKLVLKLYKIE